MSTSEIMQFAEENDVKFVRLAFCDLHGKQKNIAVTIERLEQVIAQGLRFDGSSITGFEAFDAQDLYLHPIAETMHILPWRPQQGRVLRLFCRILSADGSAFAGDMRAHLANTVKAYQKAGLHCEIGTKSSFYLLCTDDRGNAIKVPLDHGGYMDISPLDRGENVRRETCLMLETMNISTENSLHAQGPGQNAIALRHSAPLIAADDLVTFRSTASMVAAGNGLHASFAALPLKSEAPNWLQVNLSLHQSDRNLCAESTPKWTSFVSGIQKRLDAILACAYGKAESTCAPASRFPIVHNASEAHWQICFPCAQVNAYLLFSLILQAGRQTEKDAALPSEAFLQQALGEPLYRAISRCE